MFSRETAEFAQELVLEGVSPGALEKGLLADFIAQELVVEGIPPRAFEKKLLAEFWNSFENGLVWELVGRAAELPPGKKYFFGKKNMPRSLMAPQGGRRII